MSETEFRDGSKPAVWMIAGALCFSMMAALAHALGTRCGWVTIALVRAVFMFVVAATVARASGSSLPVWRPRTLWMRSLAGSFSLVCSFYALTRLPIADALTLSNTYPLWIVALTWVVARRRPNRGDVARIGCALVGVALIERPHLDVDRLATLVALLGSVSTAVAMIGLHKLREVDPKAVVAHFAGVASLVAGAWYLTAGPGETLRGGPTTTLASGIDAGTVGLLLGVGLTGTVGQIFLTKAYASGAPARVAVLGLTQVVFALTFDVVVWQRSLPLASIVGTVLVLAPTAWLLARAAGDARESASRQNGMTSA